MSCAAAQPLCAASSADIEGVLLVEDRGDLGHVLDRQGQGQRAGVGEVRVGKYIEIEMDGDADTVKAKLSEYAETGEFSSRVLGWR